MDAGTVKEKDRHLGVILAFNVRVLPDAREASEESHIRIFEDRIIYSLVDGYNAWVEEDTAHEDDAIFAELTPISQFTFMKGFVFRNSSPAVFGITIDTGMLRQKVSFMDKRGRMVGTVHQLQLDGKTVDSARKGDEVACSVQNAVIGRQLFEDDTYYTLPRSHEAKMLLARYMHRLNPEEQKTLNTIVEIQRSRDAAYAY